MMTDTVHTRAPGRAALAAAGLLAIVSAAAPPWAANEITWSPASSIIRLAKGCGDWAPTWAADGNIYTPYGDCWGVTGTLTPKRSMGLGRVAGSPATSNVRVADIDTGAPGAPDIDRTDAGGGLDALHDGKNGKKPSGLLSADGELYAWVRNIRTDGTQSRLRYSLADGTKPGSTWAWASWTLTQFGYPVFVQAGENYAGGGQYVYVGAADGPSAYVPADRFILMRVPVGSIAKQSAYQFFSGTPGHPVWVSFANRTQRTAIYTSPGRCLRNGMTYDAARGRYYWWQQIPIPSVDTRSSGGFNVQSAPEPWGPWTTVYHTDAWDVGPGEKADFPSAWMGHEGIGSPGTLYLLFSGDDFLSFRKGTIAAGF